MARVALWILSLGLPGNPASLYTAALQDAMGEPLPSRFEVIASSEVVVLNGASEPPRFLDNEFVTVVYRELRSLAARSLRRWPGHSLCPTELAHEAYLRLEGQDRASWQGRAHFLGVAALVIRRILVDHARSRASQKRGGRWKRISMAGLDLASSEETEEGLDLLDLDEAMRELRTLSPRQERVAELKLFGGLEIQEIGVALGISESVVKREWRFARAWLVLRLGM